MSFEDFWKALVKRNPHLAGREPFQVTSSGYKQALMQAHLQGVLEGRRKQKELSTALDGFGSLFR